jgi:hypothetical protein
MARLPGLTMRVVVSTYRPAALHKSTLCQLRLSLGAVSSAWLSVSCQITLEPSVFCPSTSPAARLFFPSPSQCGQRQPLAMHFSRARTALLL